MSDAQKKFTFDRLFYLIKQRIYMKTISKILATIFCVVLLVSCGDDDDKLTVIPQGPKTTKYEYSVKIKGFAEWEGFLNLDPINLEDILETDAAKNLTSADLQYHDTYLEIKGLGNLDPSPDLENLKIEVNGTLFHLGKASAGISDIQSDVQYSDPHIRKVLEKIFREFTSGNKEAKIRIGFKATEDFFEIDNVTLNLVFNIKYTWNTYTK